MTICPSSDHSASSNKSLRPNILSWAFIPTEFITSFLRLPQPIYFVFTFYCAHGPISCHFCHVGPLGLYLFSWDSSTLYLLLCPRACWLSFLSRWLIRFITTFLEIHRPIYFVFTSYCVHELAGCHSCHVDPLNLLPCFYQLCFFFLPFFLLLGFFYH